eukprot:TRINITY_DN30272_c0_g1_i2.p1 TRINITY_DN30272_c0_g1~~TRINITY_DN30272_c0_g1_i2.p1  ORF type:complete len:114 (-),score=2.64 TRINITY_DN30272_c0_g1_i2:154-495(-)
MLLLALTRHTKVPNTIVAHTPHHEFMKGNLSVTVQVQLAPVVLQDGRCYLAFAASKHRYNELLELLVVYDAVAVEIAHVEHAGDVLYIPKGKPMLPRFPSEYPLSRVWHQDFL